jgi:poly(hydroxyalkanoate) granule-associated protein
MARKKKASAKAGKPAPDTQLASAVAASAQKIWLAGLGAFARAKDEGDKMFDILVEQGRKLRERSQSAADDAMKTVRAQTEATVASAQGRWDKLEQVFEDRVSKSLNRLGVLTGKDVEALGKQVAHLNESVRSLMGAPPRAKAKKPAARKTAKKKPTRKAAK